MPGIVCVGQKDWTNRSSGTKPLAALYYSSLIFVTQCCSVNEGANDDCCLTDAVCFISYVELSFGAQAFLKVYFYGFFGSVGQSSVERQEGREARERGRRAMKVAWPDSSRRPRRS